MRNFLRSLFGSRKSASKIKTRMQSRRLELLGLEERIVPAANDVTLTLVGGVLTVTNTDDNAAYTVNNFAYSSAQNKITFNLTGAGVITESLSAVSVSGNQVTIDMADASVSTAFAGLKLTSIAGKSLDANVGAAGIDLSVVSTGSANQGFEISGLDVGQDNDTTVDGVLKSKGTGAIALLLNNNTNTTLQINSTGAITTSTGLVNLSGFSFSTAGNITTGSGSITIGSALSLSGNIAINSTSGNLSMGIVTAGAKSLTINQGSGTVSMNNIVNITTGNLSITTTNATANAIKLQNTVAAGDISLISAGDISVSGAITAASVNAKSTAGDVIFADTVTTSSVGGFTSETSDATKATKIAGAVSVGAGASALVTGNLMTTGDNTSITIVGPSLYVRPDTGPGITVGGAGNISITGKVDALASTNDLYLTAVNGAININGAVGSGTAPDQLFVDGAGSFTASSTITVGSLGVGLINSFATSVSFADAVKVTGTGYNFTIDTTTALFAAPLKVRNTGSGTISFSKTIEASNSLGSVDLTSQNGNIGVTGTITAKNGLEVESTGSGSLTLGDNITTDQTNGFVIIFSTTGDITTKGISTSGSTARIEIDTVTSGNVTINGNVSASGGGNIILGADINQGYSASGTGNLTINGTVSTTSGDIVIGSGGTGTVSVNKALTTTAANGDVVIIATGAQTNAINFSKDATITSAAEVNLQIDNPTNTISLASGANVSTVNGFTTIGVGTGNLNLASNITTTNGNIVLGNILINLTGDVSMKAAGGQQSGSTIVLDNVNGAQNLTLEATGLINFQNPQGVLGIGQITALKTVTITNSSGVSADSAFTAANLVISDTLGALNFAGPTVISTSLTTAAKAYTLRFDGTTVISGAPVFLNTGGVSFGSAGSGKTSLTNGATITGNASSVFLGGVIVSGGAFNIGAVGNTGSISIDDETQLILNSTSASSTFAKPIDVLGNSQTLKLLGVGSLTLSGDSSANTGDTISVINGTLNVTGKIASTVTSTSGTITGAGGTIGALTVNTGTVAPGGTLNTGVVTFNAATNYNAAVLNNTTASNLKTSSAINLNGANLALSSIPNGLSVGNVFTIIDNTATQTGINGTFAGLPEGASVSAKDASGNTVAFTISYKGGTNTNDVTLTVASVTPSQTATPQPMVAGQPVLNKFTAVGADAGGGPLVTITFANGTYTSFFAYDPAFRGGVRVALGDVNADGTPEVITGAGPGGGPQVNVYSVNPQTGAVSLQSSFFAFGGSTFTGGVYVAVGRTEGIFGDVIVGAGAGGGPRVQVYAGSGSGLLTSRILNDFYAYSLDFTGGVVVAAGDRLGFVVDEVITAPASNGGWNIKSFLLSGKGNNPEVIEDFFAFNNTTARGGLSLAVGYLNTGRVADLVIGTTNGAFGVIIDSNTSGIVDVPFEGFTGAIRAGVAESSSGLDYAVALAGPTGGPLVSVFAVFSNLRCVDYLFVMNPSFTGGLFGTPTLPRNFR